MRKLRAVVVCFFADSTRTRALGVMRVSAVSPAVLNGNLAAVRRIRSPANWRPGRVSLAWTTRSSLEDSGRTRTVQVAMFWVGVEAEEVA